MDGTDKGATACDHSDEIFCVHAVVRFTIFPASTVICVVRFPLMYDPPLGELPPLPVPPPTKISATFTSGGL